LRDKNLTKTVALPAATHKQKPLAGAPLAEPRAKVIAINSPLFKQYLALLGAVRILLKSAAFAAVGTKLRGRLFALF